jgi:hypothetical protein
MKAVSDRNVPRRGLLWFGAITLGLITGFMALFFSQSGWTTPSMAFEAICVAATIGLILTLINAARFWWGMRIVTLLMFAVFFWSLVDAAFVRRQTAGSDEVSTINSLRAFLFFGLPSLLYTLWGSTWGKLGQQTPKNPTRADLTVLKIAIFSRWLFLALTLIVVATAYLQISR